MKGKTSADQSNFNYYMCCQKQSLTGNSENFYKIRKKTPLVLESLFLMKL